MMGTGAGGLTSDRLPHNELGRLFLAKYGEARQEIGKEVIELDDVIEQIFIAILSDGHVILEGEPGVGKTLAVNTIAKTIEAKCSRVQFTPETLPSDLYYSLGTFDEEEGRGKTLKETRLVPGPIFTQIFIGDEINRANPRALAVLLEPLEEKQVTLEGKTTPLGDFYFFAATQNPVETIESTNELPEALQERLLLMARVPYPSPELLRKIAVHDTRPKNIEAVLPVDLIVKMQNAILEQYVLALKPDHPTVDYIERFITATHKHPVVRWGPGIRAAQDLTRAAAVHAFLHGNDRITFDDIHAVVYPALRFKFQRESREARRLGLNDNDGVIGEVIKQVSLSRGGL